MRRQKSLHGRAGSRPGTHYHVGVERPAAGRQWGHNSIHARNRPACKLPAGKQTQKDCSTRQPADLQLLEEVVGDGAAAGGVQRRGAWHGRHAYGGL